MYSKLLYKIGHYFLDIQYIETQNTHIPRRHGEKGEEPGPQTSIFPSYTSLKLGFNIKMGFNIILLHKKIRKSDYVLYVYIINHKLNFAEIFFV